MCVRIYACVRVNGCTRVYVCVCIRSDLHARIAGNYLGSVSDVAQYTYDLYNVANPAVCEEMNPMTYTST